MNNFIQNVSRFDITAGHHADAGENSMLIQIVDFFDTFPTPKYNFKEVLQFKFDDVLDGPTACTDLQAQELAAALQRAKEQHMNVIVHCFAGICRSGAVVEVGIMLGFNPPDCIRIPNSTVKNKMLKALGMKIDESTSVFSQEFYNREFDQGVIMQFKVGDWVKQKNWTEYLEVVGVDHSKSRILVKEDVYESWYPSGLFMKKEDAVSAEKSIKPDEFQVGDLVWCLHYGKGVVSNTESFIEVDYGWTAELYTPSGVHVATQETMPDGYSLRTLFFSEPKIEASVTRPFVPTLVGKRVVVLEDACYPQVFVVAWEDEAMFGNDDYKCIKINSKVYEVSPENLLKKD